MCSSYRLFGGLFLLICLTDAHSAFSQTKKRQIELLTHQRDSLKVQLDNTRYSLNQCLSQSDAMNHEYSAEIGRLKMEIEDTKAQSKKYQSERDIVAGELKSTKTELQYISKQLIRTDTLKLIEADKYETCEALFFSRENDYSENIEITFDLGRAHEDVVTNDFFVIDNEVEWIVPNQEKIGMYYIVTYDMSEHYLFYDCAPIGEEERNAGLGRSASIGYKLLSVKKL